MNDKLNKRASRLIVELGAIQAEIELIKALESEEQSSLVSVLEVEALGEAADAIEDAIGALKEAVA